MVSTTATRLATALDRMGTYHPHEIDLSLDRMHKLMDRLGNPQDRLPPTIHVAGTNGKGSTIAFMRAILEAAGLRVHVYTSPHLVHFNERIRLAGKLVDDETLLNILQRIEVHLDGTGGTAKLSATFFEITTAAAFLAFAENSADVLLLETGLGGRLDATNVIKTPQTVVITPVSQDHQEYLGHTIEKIAAEKLGILKHKVPIIIGPQNVVFYPVAKKMMAAVEITNPQLYGPDWSIKKTADGFMLKELHRTRFFPHPNLNGDHQHINAATAIMALNEYNFDEKTILAGLKNACWFGRLQHLKAGKLVDRIMLANPPYPCEIWLDGAHNIAGMMALRQTLILWKKNGFHISLGVSIMKNRDPAALLHPILPFIDDIFVVDIDKGSGRFPPLAAYPQNIASISGTGTCDAFLNEFLEKKVKIMQMPTRILFAGSLYLGGIVLEKNGTAPL